MAKNDMNSAIKSAGSSISSADIEWYNPAAVVEEYFKKMDKAERDLAAFRKNFDDILIAERMKAAHALAEEEFKLEQDKLKKRIDLEGKLKRQLTEKEAQALGKAADKDKAKKDKEANRQAKTELAHAQLRNGDILGGLKNVGSLLKDGLKEIGPELGKSAAKAIGNTLKQGVESVNEAMQLLSGVNSRIEARLLKSGESFKSINDTMRAELAASPFIQYKDMLTKVDELVSKGVAYNVELRAFLASISDKIATTFDAFDSNLLRIIRIQQEDSTKLRLGMEARLTEFLNENYQDTSYLSGAHDSVTEALTASIVLLGTGKGAEYEYAVQKWFGSLAALGVGDSTLTGLAGALNAAATGDVNSLSGSPFMNLIVMAANKAGIPYADILTLGLNADSVNVLMSQIVAYWTAIATETNQVVRKQYSELFGLDMIDMTAIKNIKPTDINKLLSESLTYTGMNKELTEQLGKVSGRMHFSEKFNNVWLNFMTGVGLNIASSPIAAATWVINDFIEKQTGGINIPSITSGAMAAVFGLDLEANMNDLIQLGMVGLSTLSLVGKVIGAIGGNGGLNMGVWGADEITRHGRGLGAPVRGAVATTSEAVYIGNSNSSDIYKSTINQAKTAGDVQSIESQAKADADKSKEQMNNIETSVVSICKILENIYSGTALRVTVENYGLTPNSF